MDALDLNFKPKNPNEKQGLLDAQLPEQKLSAKDLALFKKGYKAYQNGNLAQAMTLFTEVLRANPTHVPTIEIIGTTSHNLGNRQVALNFFKAAIELAPLYVNGHINLAKAYIVDGEIDSAEDTIKKALVIEPDNEELLQTLAYLTTGRGDKKGARETYERLFATNPKNPTSLYSFSINLHKYSDLKTDPYYAKLKKFEEKIKKFGIREKQEIYAALGKAHSDAKEYDKAFNYYKKAAETKRATINFSMKACLNTSTRIKNYFSQEYFQGTLLPRHKSNIPVFICAMPRSGTTLLEQILQSHRDVQGIGESMFWQEFLESRQIFGQGKNNAFITAPEGVKRLGKPTTFIEAGDEYIKHMEQKSEPAKRIVNKAITNVIFAGALYTIFPEAYFIHIRRNPLDCCLSCYTQQFNEDAQPYTYDLVELGQHYRMYEDLMTHWKSLFPERILTIEYEKLVTDFEAEARKVINFLDLEWDPQCLQFHEAKNFVRTASITQVRQPIYKSARNKWKNYAAHLTPLVEALGDLAPPDSLYLLESQEKFG